MAALDLYVTPGEMVSERTNEDVYQRVLEVKTLLTEKQKACLTKDQFDRAIEKLPQSAPAAPADPAAGSPGIIQQLAPLTGAPEIISNIIKQQWVPLGLAAISLLGFKFLNWDVIGKHLLSRVNLQATPEKATGIGRKPRVDPALQAPVSSVDVDRLKAMRSSSIALSRSLSDLTKEVSRAAQQIA